MNNGIFSFVEDTGGRLSGGCCTDILHQIFVLIDIICINPKPKVKANRVVDTHFLTNYPLP